LPKPPPRYPPPDQSAVSLQASRQQNALFKGLARQMTGLSALGLPNSPELQRWRATIEEDHRARRPGRKPKGSGVGSAAASTTKKKQKQKAETESDADARRSRRRRTCGVCGGEGHNARTCALASPKREHSSSDLVSYYEAKYGDRLNEPRGGDLNGGGLVSVARRDEDERKKERKKNRPVGRPRASLSIAVRCSACGALGHNRRFHETKRDFNKSRPGPQNPCTCSWCGEKGHNSRGCPARRGATAGYGFKYGYAYGRAYGYRYGFGTGAGGWVPEVSDSWNDFPAFTSDENENENENADVTRTRTRTRFAVRSKPLELRAATLWLRSRARSADPEKKDALSIGEACARVGVAARFKQNVWNATKRARKSGWVDDGAADEFLDRPEAEFEEATSAASAEGEAAAREA